MSCEEVIRKRGRSLLFRGLGQFCFGSVWPPFRVDMLRLLLRLRPCARAGPRVLPARPVALGSRPRSSGERRLHGGAGSRTSALGSVYSHRAGLLRSSQLVGSSPNIRFYSLPPHSKVRLRTERQGHAAPVFTVATGSAQLGEGELLPTCRFFKILYKSKCLQFGL